MGLMIYFEMERARQVVLAKAAAKSESNADASIKVQFPVYKPIVPKAVLFTPLLQTCQLKVPTFRALPSQDNEQDGLHARLLSSNPFC